MREWKGERERETSLLSSLAEAVISCKVYITHHSYCLFYCQHKLCDAFVGHVESFSRERERERDGGSEGGERERERESGSSERM